LERFGSLLRKAIEATDLSRLGEATERSCVQKICKAVLAKREPMNELG
jgi:hypothetical protein